MLERRELLIGGAATVLAGFLGRVTRAAAGSTVRLALVGDVGTGAPPARRVASAMAGVASARPFDGLVLLGDNVYPDGDPRELGRTVFDPYRAVLAQSPLSATLGNHDVKEGHGPGQVERLGMPGRWYSRRYGDVLLVCLDSTQAGSSSQQRFVDQVLAGTSARWRIAAFHHPPYSAGPHGSTELVRRQWCPLFERHGVQLVVSGHDHNYQRSEPVRGITYIVSGGGATVRTPGRAGFTAKAVARLHFLDVLVDRDRLELRARNDQGELFDRTTLRP